MRLCIELKNQRNQVAPAPAWDAPTQGMNRIRTLRCVRVGVKWSNKLWLPLKNVSIHYATNPALTKVRLTISLP